MSELPRISPGVPTPSTRPVRSVRAPNRDRKRQQQDRRPDEANEAEPSETTGEPDEEGKGASIDIKV